MDEKKLPAIEEVRKALASKSFNVLRRIFKSLESPDIAEAVWGLSAEDKVAVFRLIEKARKAEVFSYLDLEEQKAALEHFPEDLATFILNEMEPVDRTGLLEELSADLSGRLILRLDPEERKIARKLLSFPEDSVGRIMSPEFFSIPAGMSAGQAIEYVRWNAARYPEEALMQIFVVDHAGKYLGDTSLAALFVADDTSERVESLIGSSYVALSAYDDETEAVDMFRKYDRPAIPVVDQDGCLVGVVGGDDVFDIAEEEATEDLQQFGAAGVLEDAYFATPLFVLLKKRTGWLLILFVGGLCSGRALKSFESEIATYAFLIIFLPLVVSSGGNSGSQTASLIIRGIAIKELSLSDWIKVLGREMLAGLGLGVVLASVGFLSALVSGLEMKAACVVAFSLLGVVEFGAIVGGMLPFGLKKLGVDPAVSSSPLIASLADLVGILIFFNVALFIMKHF